MTLYIHITLQTLCSRFGSQYQVVLSVHTSIHNSKTTASTDSAEHMAGLFQEGNIHCSEEASPLLSVTGHYLYYIQLLKTYTIASRLKENNLILLQKHPVPIQQETKLQCSEACRVLIPWTGLGGQGGDLPQILLIETSI